MAVLSADVDSGKKTLIEVTPLILLVRYPGATILNARPITPSDAPYHTQLVLWVRYSGTKILNDRPIQQIPSIYNTLYLVHKRKK